MITIKKYSNRRLYDTSASRYVNLEDIAALIRAGERVEVRDAATGDDLTRAVLLQVVLEVEGARDLFPPGLLHRVIRYGADGPLRRTLLTQTAAGLELLDAQLTQLEQALPWAAGRRTARTASPPGQDGEPDPVAPAAPPAEPPAESVSSRPAPTEDLDALRERLARLEERLAGRGR